MGGAYSIRNFYIKEFLILRPIQNLFLKPHMVGAYFIRNFYIKEFFILRPIQTLLLKTTYGWGLFHQKFLYKRIFDFASNLESFLKPHMVGAYFIRNFYIKEFLILRPIQNLFFKTTYGWGLFHQKFLYKGIFDFASNLDSFV